MTDFIEGMFGGLLLGALVGFTAAGRYYGVTLDECMALLRWWDRWSDAKEMKPPHTPTKDFLFRRAA